MRALVLTAALAGCAADVPLRVTDPRAPSRLSIVDEAGAPVAGARVTWIDGGAPCDVTAPFTDAYVWSGAAISDDDGHATIDHPGGHLVRVVAPDGAAALLRTDPTATPAAIVVHPTATVTVAPTCAGATCARLVGFGRMTASGAVCELSGSAAAGPLTFAHLPRGDLELTLAAAEDADDEAFGTVRAEIGGDATLAPDLARVGGPEVVRGHVVMPGGAPPGGPSYATSVAVTCGAGLDRHVSVDPATGAFAVAHLPARACRLRASSDGDDHWERTIDVTPGGGGDVVIELAREGW